MTYTFKASVISSLGWSAPGCHLALLRLVVRCPKLHELLSSRLSAKYNVHCSCTASRTDNSRQQDCPEIILKAKPRQMKSQILQTDKEGVYYRHSASLKSRRNIYLYEEPSEMQGKGEKLLSTGVPGLLKRNAVRFAFRTRSLDDISRKVAFTQFCT